jgi:hypothetical protein
MPNAKQNTAPSTPQIYIGVKPCGCTVAIMLSTDAQRDARVFAEWKKLGHKAQALPQGEAAPRIAKCHHGKGFSMEQRNEMLYYGNNLVQHFLRRRKHG